MLRTSIVCAGYAVGGALLALCATTTLFATIITVAELARVIVDGLGVDKTLTPIVVMGIVVALMGAAVGAVICWSER